MQPEPVLKRAVYALIPDLRALRERPLFPACVYMMIGIFCGSLPPTLPVVGFVGFAAFFGFLMICLILFALKKDITFFLILMAFAAGWALMAAALPKWAADPWEPPGEARVSGRIVEAGTTRGGYASYVLDNMTVNGEPVDGCAALTVRGADTAGREGDILTASAELSRPEPSRYYGDFNARGWYMRQGIRFTAFAAEPEIAHSGGKDSLLNLPERARQYADGVLKAYLAPQNAALVDALLSGDTSDISQEYRDAFRDLGVAHLLAVSGLNISLTAGAVWLLCRKLRLPMPISWGLSFAVLLSYALFAGLTPSVLRAAVMWAVMMGGMAFARRYDPLSSISAAAIIILALNPLDLFDAGFQLSFAATAAIFLWLAPLMKRAPKNKLLRAFFGSAALTVCATLFALPIILGCFNQISPISPLANLLLVPASFVMQLGGTALLFAGVFPGAAQLLGDALNAYASFYLHNVTMLTWSSAPVYAATPALWMTGLFAVLALLVSPSVVRMRRGGRAAAAVALSLVTVLMLTPASAAFSWHSDAAIVSEGSSALSVWWRAGGKSYAACGQDWQELSGYLRSRGISHLDGLYVLRTSPPKDGSMLEAGNGIEVDTLYVPEKWLGDPKAGDFLGQGALAGMRPASAEDGPFALETGGASASLRIPAAGGAIAYVPYASAKDFAEIAPSLAAADAVALNVPASRAGKLLRGINLQCLALPGMVEGPGYKSYNSTVCGSIEVEQSGGALRLSPWREGWTDGLQGNFR